MTTQTNAETWEKEFDDLLQEWGKGFYWKEEGYTPRHAELLPEADKKLKSFIADQIAQARREVLEEVKAHIHHLAVEQVEMYEGKLPFVVFQGKADEPEKIAYYRAALSDLHKFLTSITH